MEVSKLIYPELTILISRLRQARNSAHSTGGSENQNPQHYSSGFFHPSTLAGIQTFGAVDKKLLKEILHDTDPHFANGLAMHCVPGQTKHLFPIA
ncbi:MAG: hypothetical protein R2792_05610 [Saprospiraceae bacterium]